MIDGIDLRTGSPADLESCSRICFDGFKGINQKHGFPPDFQAPEVAAGLMGLVLNSPHVYGVVAEAGGRVVGSCFLWEGDAIAGVGPVTRPQGTASAAQRIRYPGHDPKIHR